MKSLKFFSVFLGVALLAPPLRANAQFLFEPPIPDYPPYSAVECTQALRQWETLKQTSPIQRSSKPPKNYKQWDELGLELEECEQFDAARDAYRRIQIAVGPSFIVRTFVKQQNFEEALNVSRQNWQALNRDDKFTEAELEARALNSVGLQAARQGQLPQAKSYFQKSSQLASTYGEPYRNLGELYAKENQLDLALQSFEAYLERSVPSRPPAELKATATLQVAKALEWFGDPVGATQWFRKAIEINPQYDAPYFLFSDFQIKQKRYDDALATLEVWRQLNPSAVRVYHSQGYIYALKGDYPNAIALYKKALEPIQDEFVSLDAHAHETLGHQLNVMGRYADSADQFEHVSQFTPDHVLTYVFQGENLVHLKQWDEAIAAFETAKSLLRQKSKPTVSEALRIDLMLAPALARVNRVVEAMQLLKSFQNTPVADSPALSKALGDLYTQDGNLAEAAKFYQTSVKNRGIWWFKTTPEAKALAAQGQTLGGLARYEDAIAVFQQAIAADSEFAWAYSTIGKAQRELNQLAASVSSYEKALQLRPRDQAQTHIFWSGLGLTHLAQNKLDLASQSFKQALVYQEKNVEAHYGLGQTQLKQGNITGAIASFERCLELQPHHPTAEADLSQAHQLIQTHSKSNSPEEKTTRKEEK